MYADRVPRPFAKATVPMAYFPLGGPVPAGDLVGREGYIRRAVAEAKARVPPMSPSTAMGRGTRPDRYIR